MNNNFFNEEDVIYSYTSEQAEQDGILFNVTRANQKYEDGPFNYVTFNLLNRGYIKNGQIDLNNLNDLLCGAFQIIKRKSNNFTQIDAFFAGKIELPDGSKQEIFIELNETNKFTILLPEDH